MAVSKINDRLSYGVTILVFGIIFLLDKIGILDKIPYGGKLMSVGAFFLIAGIIFLITQPKKILGWVFTAVGVILNADLFFGRMDNYSIYIVPLALIIVGIIMVFTSSKNKN
ncbi:LiaF transmembrane domain-containing protein [Dysgonomonas sp. ZJ279]|uniref:LiaF transmembrane domain-containing protein n=1 Tax=Dysgonomonas sp. ZJ279 TaxID=2709796 RepID=UPI0013EB0D98|nr:hypothetical protein [Dysgonomonas sp. ZJ279]